MPDPVVALNAFVGSGEVQHIEFGDPHSFRELKILSPTEAVTFISMHVPVGLLQTLYTFDRSTKVLVRGELAFVKGDRPQHCIKAVSIARVDPDGLGKGALVGYEAAAPRGLPARPAADRRRRHRKRQAGGSARLSPVTALIGVSPRSSAGVKGSNVTPRITMQGKERDCMAIDVEVIYPSDDPGTLSRSWTWQAPGPTVIDALHQTWREFNAVEEHDPHVARKARSMCVGDLIAIQGQTFVVAGVDFLALALGRPVAGSRTTSRPAS
jgi:hypothetical protein